MKPLLQHASRLLTTNIAIAAPSRSAIATFRSSVQSTRTTSICLRCHSRATFWSSKTTARAYNDSSVSPSKRLRRHFTSSTSLFDKQPTEPSQPQLEQRKIEPQNPEPSPINSLEKPITKVEDTVRRVPP